MFKADLTFWISKEVKTRDRATMIRVIRYNKSGDCFDEHTIVCSTEANIKDALCLMTATKNKRVVEYVNMVKYEGDLV